MNARKQPVLFVSFQKAILAQNAGNKWDKSHRFGAMESVSDFGSFYGVANDDESLLSPTPMGTGSEATSVLALLQRPEYRHLANFGTRHPLYQSVQRSVINRDECP
jgi:hypothetical protein